MVNVTNLNFLFVERDLHIPSADPQLTLTRTYNSESLHDANNDDGSTPSVFGNQWTNNYDIHLAWSSTGQNSGTVSVYTQDGSRNDFTCQTNVVQTCTTMTSGVYDLLASTDLSGGLACQFQLTKKDGTSYVFYAPYTGCGTGPGSYGRLLGIYGRNSTYYETLTYGWNPSDSNPENLSTITVTHEPDGNQLSFLFGQISGTNITELLSVTLPDSETVNYHYNSTGNLVDVDKPGNNPVLPSPETLPTNFLDGNPIAKGNLPETYALSQVGGSEQMVLEVCGPRAAISIIDTNGNPTDGACIDFDYVPNENVLADWWTRGVLNPAPPDSVLSPSAIQSGPSTGFVQWDDTSFFNNNQGSYCNPESESGMQDAYAHNIVWCYDGEGRVTNTIAAVSSSSSLATSQSWDSNNDLVAVTDARGHETDMAYDTNGNLVEIALPSQSFAKPTGTYRATYFIDHDNYNNPTRLCDPANNPSNGWNPSPGPTPCAASNSTAYASLTYDYADPNEAFGCLTQSSKPSGYSTTYTYSGANCGSGEPQTVSEQAYTQADQSHRAPSQSYTYKQNGLLKTYNSGNPGGGLWQYSYSTDGMYRTLEVQDPDNVPSYACYNQDGSVFFTETAYQDYLDFNGNGPTCPTYGQLEAGAASPTKSTAYHYDADRNVALAVHRHGCPDARGNCPGNQTATTQCYSTNVTTGTTCNFYDGLDRLVEVKLPFDVAKDLYQNPWVTRYLYDLTGQSQSFHGQSFVAHGNLFATQELVAPTPTPSVIATPYPPPTSVPNQNYTNLKAYAYDELNRIVTTYAGLGAGNGSSSYSMQSYTWDSSPLNGTISGYLGEVCNSATPPPSGQCQEFDYYPDGEEKTFASEGSAPERQYQYDADGRAVSISENGYTPLQYTYNVDGALTTSVDAAQTSQGVATLTYSLYPDDSREYLSVSSTALTQPDLFSYSYRNDGPMSTYAINDSNVPMVSHPGITTIAYQSTNAGRLSTRTESGAGINTSLGPTQLTYQYGLLSQEVTPVTTLSGFTYTAENELTQVTSTPNVGSSNCFGPLTFMYTVRGELGSPPSCSESWNETDFANGVAIGYSIGPCLCTYSWNDVMKVVGATSTSSGPTSRWSYDGAGRMVSESEPYPWWSPGPLPVKATRSYDAENHLTNTTFATPSPSPAPNANVLWGPDGHPILIEVQPGGVAVHNERLHWDGDSLLFTTRNDVQGNPIVDDIKVDVQGDILPRDNGYNGLTFFDRGPGGSIMGCHNINGISYLGLGAGWAGVTGNPCAAYATGAMPTSLVWAGSPYNGLITTVGSGGTLGMYRTDGFSDGFDVIQGTRAFDPTSNTWTSPDSYGGSIEDPMTQQSYAWNNDNPMDYSDPSGYDGQSGSSTPQQPEQCSDPQCEQEQSCTTACGDNPPDCSLNGGGPSCTSSNPLCNNCQRPVVGGSSTNGGWGSVFDGNTGISNLAIALAPDPITRSCQGSTCAPRYYRQASWSDEDCAWGAAGVAALTLGLADVTAHFAASAGAAGTLGSPLAAAGFGLMTISAAAGSSLLVFRAAQSLENACPGGE